MQSIIKTVLLSDVVNSRKIPDRLKFSEQLAALTKRVKSRFGNAFEASLRTTKGVDELSAVVAVPEVLPSILIELAMGFYPVTARFIAVVGEVDILSKNSTLADGPAFHHAAKLMALAKQDGSLFKLSITDELGDEIVSRMFSQSLTMIGDWPKKTAEIAFVKRKNPKLDTAQIAHRFQVSRQAISKALVRSKLDEIEYSENLLKRWIARNNVG